MIELIIMGAVLALLLHTSRMVVQHINQSFQLGTLAPLDVIASVTEIDASREQGIRVKKIVGNWFIEDLTAGQGPILVGMEIGVPSAALVEEALEADPQDIDDTVAMEQANRAVMPQKLLTHSMDTEGSPGVLNYQEDIYLPFRNIPEGTGLGLWAYNTSAAALSTTDPLVSFIGTVVGEWLRD